MHLPKKYLHFSAGNQKIELPFGSKLLSDEHILSVGGSGANVAVGLSRLGVKSLLISSVGNDEIGLFIETKLEDESLTLELDHLKEPSPLSVILSLEGERTIITSHDEHRTYLKKPLPETGHLHFGPISDDDSEAYFQQVISHVVKTDQTISVNPSMFAIEQRDRAFLALLKIAKIIFLNQEEGARLARLTPKTEPEEIIKTMRRLTQGVVCLTCGERGAFVTQGVDNYEHEVGKIYFAAALDNDSERVDTTGAGDAFTSAFLACFLADNKEIAQEDLLMTALKWGIVNSGSVVATLGAEDGLLGKEKIEKDLKTVMTKII